MNKLLAIVLLSTPSFAQGLLWSVPGPAAQTVSLAPDGVYTASHLGASNTRSHALNDGAVTWQEQSPGMSWHVRTSGAASIFDADVPGSGSNVQRVYVRTPGWLWQFPNTVSNTDRLGISTSRDGQRIAAFSNTTLVVFDNGTPTTLDLGFTGLGIDLSADGSTVLVTGDFATRVYAVPSLAVLFSASPSSYTFHAQGISGNGDVFAIGRMGRVDVWRRTAGVYGFDFQHTLAGTNYCDRLDVSDDGSTMAAAFDFFGSPYSVTLDVVDLATQAVTNHVELAATFAHRVSISGDGQIVALGVAADGLGPVPELSFYRRGAVSALAAYSVDGAVLDLDLAANGATCAVGTQTAGTGNAGFVSLYRVLARLPRQRSYTR